MRIAHLPSFLQCSGTPLCSGLAVQFPRLMVLGNFSLPSLSLGLEVVQEFLAAIDLAKFIHGPYSNMESHIRSGVCLEAVV